MRTLLLADDNVTVQRVIALTFAQEPVRIVTASDGHQAMDRVMVERPDIVLAGTTLPQVNGYELARFVKSKTGNVPVLLLSGAFETVDEALLKSSGANGVIEKPVEPIAVISRVKELLGIHNEAQAGAPASGPADRKSPAMSTMPRMVTTSRPMPVDPRREAPPTTAPPAEPPAASDDYLNSLDSAFDSLDQQLAGRIPAEPDRNPSPPIGRVAAGEPRSPGKRPPAETNAPGNPVYEVDDAWFGDSNPADAAQADLMEDLRAPDLQRAPPPASSQPVYEVDDEWFAEDRRTREARDLEQRQLAAEMGIHEVELPEPNLPAPPVASDDFAFGVEDLAPKLPEVREVPEVLRVPEVAEVPEVLDVPPAARVAPLAKMFVPEAAKPARPGRVADDFAAMLAFEQGEKKTPPMIEPVIHAVAPEITPEMIELIAASVADRLKGSIHVEPAPPEINDAMLERVAEHVASRLKDSIRIEPAIPELNGPMLDQIAATVASRLSDTVRDSVAAATRDTVRAVVSETSERLVREEIERIKSKNQ